MRKVFGRVVLLGLTFAVAWVVAGALLANNPLRALTQSPSTAAVPTGIDAFAFETITVSTVAIGFTNATISPTNAPSAKAAFCTIEAASAQTIRYRYDGTAPTASVGHYALAAVVGTAAPQTLSLQGINNLLRFRAIRQGATDVTLRCTYLR